MLLEKNELAGSFLMCIWRSVPICTSLSAESIWQEHEQEFLEFCMQEAEDQCYFHRRSTDGP